MDKLSKAKKKHYIKVGLAGALLLVTFALSVALVVVKAGPVRELWVQISLGIVCLLGAGYLFVEALLEDEEEPELLVQEEQLPSSIELEFMEQMKGCMNSIDRTQKAIFAVLKKIEEQGPEETAQIINLAVVMDELLQKQSEHTQTLVKYNKENARQVAINQGETLERIKSELITAIQALKTEKVLDAAEEEDDAFAAMFTDDRTYYEDDGIGEEISLDNLMSAEELENDPLLEDLLVDFPEEEPADVSEPDVAVTEELSEPEEFTFAEEPADVDLDALLDGLTEDTFANFDEPEEAFTEPEEEPVKDSKEEQMMEDAFATTGVDLSDPNAALTPEDIAKLFAAAGN